MPDVWDKKYIDFHFVKRIISTFPSPSFGGGVFGGGFGGPFG